MAYIQIGVFSYQVGLEGSLLTANITSNTAADVILVNDYEWVFIKGYSLFTNHKGDVVTSDELKYSYSLYWTLYGINIFIPSSGYTYKIAISPKFRNIANIATRIFIQEHTLIKLHIAHLQQRSMIKMASGRYLDLSAIQKHPTYDKQILKCQAQMLNMFCDVYNICKF